MIFLSDIKRKKDGRPDYRIDGDPVPSVTTVISKSNGWPLGALMGWANKIGREHGIHHRKYVDEAGRAGTLCHAFVESSLTGKPEPDLKGYTKEEIALANQGFSMFQEWFAHFNFELLASEISLVSRKFKTGGTLDIVGRLSGVISLLDIKTSNFLGKDMVAQVSTYKPMWNENFPKHKIKKLYIIKLGKEDASFSWHQIGPKSEAAALKAFKHWRALYDLEKEIKI